MSEAGTAGFVQRRGWEETATAAWDIFVSGGNSRGKELEEYMQMLRLNSNFGGESEGFSYLWKNHFAFFSVLTCPPSQLKQTSPAL